MPETEPEITVQVAVIDTSAYLESCQTSKMCKNRYSMDPKYITICWKGI